MPNIGMQEMVVIIVLALVFLGPKRLPDVARRAGQLLRDFRRASGGAREEIRAGFESDDNETDGNFPYMRPPSETPKTSGPTSGSSLADAPWPSTPVPSSNDAADPRA